MRHSARDMAALLQDPDGEVRLAALRCLGRIGKGARGTRFRAAMYFEGQSTKAKSAAICMRI